MSQSFYIKSRPDLLTLGELEGKIRNLEKCLEWRNRDEVWCVESANVVDT